MARSKRYNPKKITKYPLRKYYIITLLGCLVIVISGIIMKLTDQVDEGRVSINRHWEYFQINGNTVIISGLIATSFFLYLIITTREK